MQTLGQKILVAIMVAVVAAQLMVLLLLHHPDAVSRFLTTLMTMLAVVCILWRCQRLPQRERVGWWWMGAAIALWGIAQSVEVFVGGSTAASNLAADPSDLLYLTAAFPLLMAISTTVETESIHGVAALNLIQVLLAGGLVYIRLFGMRMAPDVAATAMLKIYATECTLLAIAALIRLATWSTTEERQRMRMLCFTLWVYLPVELFFDFGSKWWGLQRGTVADILWSSPFLFAGWQALRLPIEDAPSPRSRFRGHRTALLLQSLCPMLITVGVFALAISVWSQHFLLASGAMLLLLLVQGLQSAMIQMSYLEGRTQLLARESDLKEANAALEKLSLLDPLTGVANRRQFNLALEAEWKRAMRRQESLAVLMIDIDFFKGVNDRHGHAYGDSCLVKIAHLLRDELRRGNDLLARYGGEEFVVLLPDTGIEQAGIVAGRMSETIHRARLANNASPFDQRITVSIGLSASQPWPTLHESDLVESADQALYAAKHAGRDRIGSQPCQPGEPTREMPQIPN
jgi:diguanylate cyclase (GGDEF)-like protein